MKTDVFASSVCPRVLAFSALLCFSVFAPKATGTESDSRISVLQSAPLGLPRLTPEARKAGNKPVQSAAFEEMYLLPTKHAKQVQAREHVYLVVEANAEWSQKLRDQRAGSNYVSFTLNISAGSEIDIDGASIVIEQSQRDPSYAALRVNGTDRSINHEMPWLLFGGARMAALDMVTVKVDRKTNTWAMWFRDTLVAEDIPLAKQSGAAPQIRVAAGKGGAWICGLVCSDENPLFEDANDNGIPDEFEQGLLGKLLDGDASAQTRANMRFAWEESRRMRPPSEFILATPPPDSFPQDCDPEGQVVHGMGSGLKFGAPRKK